MLHSSYKHVWHRRLPHPHTRHLNCSWTVKPSCYMVPAERCIREFAAREKRAACATTGAHTLRAWVATGAQAAAWVATGAQTAAWVATGAQAAAWVATGAQAAARMATGAQAAAWVATGPQTAAWVATGAQAAAWKLGVQGDTDERCKRCRQGAHESVCRAASHHVSAPCTTSDSPSSLKPKRS
eukprot:366181-Chlamydomonas_euryale.AAC.12